MIYFIKDEIEISKLFYARQGEAEMTAAEKRARKRERKRLEEQRLFAEESANMTLEQKKTLLMQLGVPKAAAEHYLKQESDIWAVLPAFRFLKPLNDDLEFYKGGYKQMIERRIADGSLDERFPEVAALIKAGAAIEDIERFAYDLLLEAYHFLLYHLDDHTGAEVSDVFGEEDFSRYSYARLVEFGPDHQPTGRVVIEVHDKIPFSDL